MSLPGQLSSRYQVLRLLGSGGFGQVLLARDQQLRREVAVKLLDASFEDPDHLERFQQEARITSSLQHPNIVTLFDFGVLDRHAYIVYDFVPGRDLEDILQEEEPVPISQILRWGWKIAQALQVAHRKGIIHRDLKPANILIREGDGEPLLCDFGIARRPRGKIQTREGLILGTPAYVAPEIWEGEVPGPRSDQWSWTATLFELVYGDRVQPLAIPKDIWARLQGGWTAQIPEDQLGRFPQLEKVLLRALANDPEERFPDMEAFAAALRHPLTRRTTDLSRTWPSRKRNREPQTPGGSTRNPLQASGRPASSRRRLGSYPFVSVTLLSMVLAGFFLFQPAPPQEPLAIVPPAPQELPDQESREPLFRSLKKLLEDPERGSYSLSVPSWERSAHYQVWLERFLDPRLELALKRHLSNLRAWFQDLDQHQLWGHPQVQSLLGSQILPQTLGIFRDLETFATHGLVVMGKQLDISRLDLDRGAFILAVEAQRQAWRGQILTFLLESASTTTPPPLAYSTFRTGLEALTLPAWSPELDANLEKLLDLWDRPGSNPYLPTLQASILATTESLGFSSRSCSLRERVLSTLSTSVRREGLDARILLVRVLILSHSECPSAGRTSSLHLLEQLLEELEERVRSRPEVAAVLARRVLDAFFSISQSVPRSPKLESYLRRTRALLEISRAPPPPDSAPGSRLREAP